MRRYPLAQSCPLSIFDHIQIPSLDMVNKVSGGKRCVVGLTAADIAAGTINKPAAPGPITIIKHHYLVDVVAIVEVQFLAH